MSFFDNFGSLVDQVGGFLEDVTENAAGVANNLATIGSALNAVQKPYAGSKPKPSYVPVDMGVKAKKSASPVLPLLLIGGVLLLAARKG